MSNTGYKYIYRTESGRFQLKIWTGFRNKQFGVYKTLEEAIKKRAIYMEQLGLKLYLDK